MLRSSAILVFASLLFLFASGTSALFSQEPYDPGFFRTPVSRDMFWEEGFAEWCQGKERRIEHPRGISQVLNSQDSTSQWRGVEFGISKNLGPRHLRIPLKQEISVGTLLVCGIGTPSILKDTLENPQNAELANEELWIPGRRVADRRLINTEDGLRDDSYAAWIFPPGTKTQAIRFTHVPKSTDKSYTGWLGGIYVLSRRVLNLAPYGIAHASSEGHKAARINDRSDNSKWEAWDNGSEGRTLPISEENPEFVSIVWDSPVDLHGLCTIWSGFRKAQVEVYVGPPEKHPNESLDASDWKTLLTRTEIRAGYTQPMYPVWYDFGRSISTRAVRLRITEVAREDHEHIRHNMKEGKRVWLGELLAFTEWADADILAALPKMPEETHPPIPVPFELEEDSLVTLVIEKGDGTRVRNLLAETPFPKGKNIAWWDGSDDLLRDPEAAKHGLYGIPTRLVPPGRYTVRGLSRKPLKLHYEFSVYNEGNPPWSTPDNTGGWLTNHTPACCALWVPETQSPTGAPLVYLGSYVSEGGHGLAWFEIDENKKKLAVTKKGGVGWIGGHWTGAQYLARDYGEKRNTEHNLYAASAWRVDGSRQVKTGEVRITGLKSDGGSETRRFAFSFGHDNRSDDDWGAELGGFAIDDDVAVFSLTKLDELVFLHHKTGEVRKKVPWKAPGGLAFNPQGDLFLLSEGNLYRWKRGESPKPDAKPLVTNLDAPRHVTFDSQGNIYISENGRSHCVRVFNSKGEGIGTIGKPGIPRPGPYDELRMNHPNGMTVDDGNRLWVTETDFSPKRVSVWTLDGQLIRAFYGPAEYGGGGKLDPGDPAKFYYHGMEFRLDWKAGTNKLDRVFFRSDADETGLPGGWASCGCPEFPLYPEGATGPRYFTNCYNSNPTGGAPLSSLWFDDPETGIVKPVVIYGRLSEWELLRQEEFRSRYPVGIKLREDGRYSGEARFLWCDLNRDGRVQPEEIEMEPGEIGAVQFTVHQGRLQILATRLGDGERRDAEIERFVVLYPEGSRRGPVPVFSLKNRAILASGVDTPRSSGGDQSLFDAENDRCVVTLGITPFATESICGTKSGKSAWSYPNPWPGLHASHESPKPTQSGQLIGVTRLLGDFVKTPYPRPVFAVNGNQGNIYLMTSDGLFVAELFHDIRLAPTWSMPVSERNMEVGGLSLHDENFWPSITQTADGKIFLVDGANSALVRIDGLDTIKEIKPFEIELTKEDLAAAESRLVDEEHKRQKTAGRPTLRIPLHAEAIKIDGVLDDWDGADLAMIDRSGTAAYFDSGSKPYDITASLAVSGDRLAAAFRTNLKDLLRNSGQLPLALFKNGGCLDIMIGANPDANPDRRDPVEGDIRLLVTLVENRPRAVLYRAVVPGTKEPVPFSSPSRTITLDEVVDVSDKLEFATGDDGIFELSVPLHVLGLKPQKGMKIKGDVGILRGNGVSTLARVYWSNKATGIVSDVPSEAQLTPALWGNWTFE